jgi:hypothetical protein
VNRINDSNCTFCSRHGKQPGSVCWLSLNGWMAETAQYCPPCQHITASSVPVPVGFATFFGVSFLTTYSIFTVSDDGEEHVIWGYIEECVSRWYSPFQPPCPGAIWIDPHIRITSNRPTGLARIWKTKEKTSIYTTFLPSGHFLIHCSMMNFNKVPFSSPSSHTYTHTHTAHVIALSISLHWMSHCQPQ